jgi:hypothetical protein
VTRRRASIAALLVVAALAAALVVFLVARGRHSNAGGTRAAITHRVADYADAARRRDYARACADMTPAARQTIRVGAASYLANPTCPAVLRAISPRIASKAIAALDGFRITRVAFKTDSGQAVLVGHGASIPLRLRRVGGQWLVDGNGG